MGKMKMMSRLFKGYMNAVKVGNEKYTINVKYHK